MPTYKTVDEYIAGFSGEASKRLLEIRKTVKDIAPEAEEAIKYGIPTFTLNGNLVHFAAFENHIGFYPTPRGIEHFKKELSDYKNAKGSVQFPHNRTLPLQLIRMIVEFRVNENSKKKK